MNSRVRECAALPFLFLGSASNSVDSLADSGKLASVMTYRRRDGVLPVADAEHELA